MPTTSLPHALVAFAFAVSLAAGCGGCSLTPPGSFPTDDVEDLTSRVIGRTQAYVDADEELAVGEKGQRRLALSTLRIVLDEREVVTRERFRELSEDPFAWHDAYVRDDPSLEEWQRDSDLLSTEILRERYWPPDG